MATALVSGGAGFLGSHLSDHLLAKGHRVLCVDNLDTGSLGNIEHIRDDAFVFVNHDMVEHLDVEASRKRARLIFARPSMWCVPYEPTLSVCSGRRA